MLRQLMYGLGLFKFFDRMKTQFIEQLQYTLETEKMSNIYDFDRILKTQCNLQHFTRNCRIKNLDDFERDEADAQSRTFKCEGERNDHMLHYEQVFGNVFERRESKCCAVLMKYRRKVKGEQVVILQMDQQLKTKNISDVSGQLFCCQCKDKFLLETD